MAGSMKVAQKNADLVEKAAAGDVLIVRFKDGTVGEYKVSGKGNGYLDCAELKGNKETGKQFRIKPYLDRNLVGATQLINGAPTTFKYGQLDAVEIKRKETESAKLQQPKAKPSPIPKKPAEKKVDPPPKNAELPKPVTAKPPEPVIIPGCLAPKQVEEGVSLFLMDPGVILKSGVNADKIKKDILEQKMAFKNGKELSKWLRETYASVSK